MPPPSFRLSVLDQSPVSEGSSGAQALRNTIDLAQLADRLGYHRYWVAEHHGGPMLAGPSPEALIGPIAAATTRIRVGSGGVMLPHYSPLKVAETFSLLAGLFPGRIDLALGRAAGTDPLTTFALQRDRRQAAPDDFPQQLEELLGYLYDRLPDDHPFARLAKTLPGRPEMPEPWLLGSSQQSAIWAAELGLPYAFADFINPRGAEIAALYRERFAEHEHAGADGNVGGGVSGGAGEGGGGSADEGEGTSGGAGEGGSASGSGGGRPRVAVGVWVICAETDEEARRLATSGRMTFTLLRRGQLIAVPSPEIAVEFLAADDRTPGQPRSERRAIVGAPATVRTELEDVVAKYGAEEAIVVSITYAHEARRRSYELLAQAFGLEV
jgi:alkanesulfonate monooxygenase SsuD/methylene tetrahydromethanopterin reductase-like flavin-dependent oxidoreductase (luciferase family)